MDVKKIGITKDMVLRSRRTLTNEEEKKPMSPRKWRKLKRSPRKRT